MSSFSILVLMSLIKFGTSFDVFADLGFEDPLTNYADNFNNRIAGLVQECTTGTNGVFGTCRNSIHCRLLGGVPSGRGSCSSIFDTCCSVNRGCGRITKTKVSTFENPSIVPQEGGECYYTAYVVNSNVCQVRIDFNTTMSLPRPADGECADDRITFEDTTELQTPVICGTNTNQHLYLRVDSTIKSIRIRAHFASRTGTTTITAPMWTMKLTQMECPGINTELLNPYHRIQAAVDYSKLAPRGCLQYFIPTQGTFTTFNSNGVAAEGTYEPNLEYSMCFYRPRGSCGVRLTFVGMLDAAGTDATTILYVSEATAVFTLPTTDPIISNTYGPFYMKFRSLVGVGPGLTVTYQTDLPCLIV